MLAMFESHNFLSSSSDEQIKTKSFEEIRDNIEGKKLEKEGILKFKKLLNGYQKSSNFQKIDVYLLKGIFDKHQATFDLKFEMNENQELPELEQKQSLASKVSAML